MVSRDTFKGYTIRSQNLTLYDGQIELKKEIKSLKALIEAGCGKNKLAAGVGGFLGVFTVALGMVVGKITCWR